MKKTWMRPRLTVFGTLAQLTQQGKIKKPGFRDDFGVAGISNSI